MLTWLLLIPIATVFVAINIIIGCYVTIRLGYGPPDWKTALNLVVRLTTLQDRLNASRDWIDKKAPWADKLLVRLRVPKPIIIVEVPEPEEKEETTDEINEIYDETAGEAAIIQSGDISGVSADEPTAPQAPRVAETEQTPQEPEE